MHLTDRITARIRSWGSRQLSYAGRLALINSVLATLHSYWSSIFLIPNGIMNKIEAICRNFLWSGKDSYQRAPNVSWDTCCSPKDEGGLGIKDLKTWNRALLGKYTWWLANKKDHLWVRWISHVYMKDTHWSNYDPPPDCSWTLKKIAHSMILFKQAYTNDLWLASDKEYTVTEGYAWLRQSKPKVLWRHICWSPMNVPKWSFIFWAVQLKRLLTKDRMIQMGFGHDPCCYLCSAADESHDHLFYQCPFSTHCISYLQQKLGVHFSADSLARWDSNGRARSKLQRKIISSCHVGVTYCIWNSRNKARLDAYVLRPENIVRNVIKDVLARFWAKNSSVLSTRDVRWIQGLS
ncbi:uncharacterized protein LOC141641273 [Silene latifolia]|uniref:uncharacterized protein LOC141641273 n=1 Tax=Silene latifolia TaxID=37657 RepID=UPI003D77B4DB